MIVETVIPGLGTVRGVKTFAEIAGQAPPAVADAGPAVETKPLSGQPAAANPAGAETPGAAAGDPVAEAKARHLLNLGKAYLKAGIKAKAAAKFKEVVDTYAGTNAAKEAAEMLTRGQ